MSRSASTNNNHLVILAGGIGSRFWPVSSPEMPKQFLDILNCGKTLLQLTVERYKGICPEQNIWVVTSEQYASIVAEQLPSVPVENILKEPCRRNTAPCIAYVSWKIKKINPKANIVVSPSDHVVKDENTFQDAIMQALDFAAETDSIVTLGIKPDHPETGYGYIEADLSYSSTENKNIFRVDSFKEKPTLELATVYAKSNNCFWNSGVFIWNVNTIVNAFRVYHPAISKVFENMLPYYGTEKEQELLNQNFPKCENISVDYAIMEKAEEIFVFPVDCGWSDLGSWSALKKQMGNDMHGNACIGEHIDVYETNNCIIHAPHLKKVVVQGLDGYVVVEKDGVLMICKLSEEQRVKLFH